MSRVAASAKRAKESPARKSRNSESIDERQLPDAFETTLSRFIVGIDLGTTNCAVAFIDTEATNPRIENFEVQQWIDFGTSEKRELLPSFLYQALPEEAERLGDAGREDPPRIVGTLARDRGLQLPGRQVASAKSWLCHDGVDRRAAILPWQNDEGVEKLSPVEASSSYLRQILSAWNAAHGKHPLAEQDIVLTLPASFDQVARQLTIEAAAMAGLPRVLPIEEPQAAFYAWLARHAENWESQVHPGQTILVCDIGGGTTDFTLIRVRSVQAIDSQAAESRSAGGATTSETKETLDERNRRRRSLHRVAVGQHLILGGDNLDLALAKMAEGKLAAPQNKQTFALPPRAWDALRQACRLAKEVLLGQSPPQSYTIHLPGSGSRLLAGGQQIEVTAEDVRRCVLDGFFPFCELDDRPLAHASGFQEFGLPFAQDAAVTRHLAAFLWDHRHDGRSDEEIAQQNDWQAARPDWILFNGGVMASTQLTQRIVEAIARWFAGREGIAEDWRPQVLDGARLDLGVAIGAAYFGQVRRGIGVEIEAKLACSYYLQTSIDPPTAMCIVPGSASPGDRFALSTRPFELAIGQPVQFPIVYSTTRMADKLAQSVTIDAEHFSELPSIRTVIEATDGRRSQAVVPVVVEVELSQIGTLQMYCQSCNSQQRWKLEFDVRGSTQTDREIVENSGEPIGIVDEQMVDTARSVLAEVFAENNTAPPGKLVQSLARNLDRSKSDWPPHLLRAIWSELMELQSGRRKSAEHEARWLNLLGYSLRPGYGLAADDWRVAQTWRAVHGKLQFATAGSRNEAMILWRRIAGGFTPGQQLTVYQQVASPLRAVLDPSRRSKGGGGVSPNELSEMLRLVASLELLPKSEKAMLARWLIDMLGNKKWAAANSAILWAIGRLGSRVPAYGPLNCVVDADVVSDWLERLIQARIRFAPSDSTFALALMLCARRTRDRYRDIDDDIRDTVVQELRSMQAPVHYVVLVEEGGQLAGEEAAQVLGESLPLGLTVS